MAITEEDRRRMGTTSPALVEAMQKYPALEFVADDKQRQRRADHLAKLRHLYPIPGPIPDLVTETAHSVKARDGYEIPIRIYKPVEQSHRPFPVLLTFHEGGGAMGDLTDEDLNCRMASRDLGMVCINVEYRLQPEHPWPINVLDCYDVVKWVAKNAVPSNTLIPGDPRVGFIVSGASAGGNFAAVACQLARDDGMDPPLTGQYLSMPALLWHDVVPEKWKSECRSRFDSAEDPILGMFMKVLPENPGGKGCADALLNPLLHPNLKELPPCYFQVAGLDPFRDEALIYERVLSDNGVKTKIDVYDGYGHVFATNWPLLDRSGDFFRDTRKGLEWLVGLNK